MPTLPLLANPTPADPDEPRHVVAPGGYEWWYFEAHDPAAGLRVTAILFDGMPFHPGYLRRYTWYRRFPTRVRPPLPREYPCVFLAVYENDVRVERVLRRHAPGECRAASDAVQIGADRFARLDDGAWRLTIGRAVDLTFRPGAAHVPQVRAIAAGSSVAEPHGWVVSHPHCRVEGELLLRGRPVRFDGVGYQDHNWGAEPISLAARRWLWACTWLEDRALVVGQMVPAKGGSDGPHLLDSPASGSATWDGRTSLRIPFPTSVDFGEALRLDEPRVVDTSPILVQLRYRARVGGVTTVALAHVVEPGRAGWPLLARMYQWKMERAAREQGQR